MSNNLPTSSMLAFEEVEAPILCVHISVGRPSRHGSTVAASSTELNRVHSQAYAAALREPLCCRSLDGSQAKMNLRTQG